MANTVVKIKRTSTAGKVPNTVNLPNAGELAINMTDGILYSTNGSTIFEIGANNTTVKITNSISVGSNVTVNLSTISVGNSSVNTQITSTQVNTDIIQLDVAAYVGTNVSLLESGLYVGNSTVNSFVNSTSVKITNSTSSVTANTGGVYLTNNGKVSLSPLAGGSNVYFIQQNDDNFVFYSTDTSNQPRAVWSIYANSTISNLQIQTRLQPLSGIVANGSLGTSGQVLYSNGSSLYWASPSAGSVDQNAQYTWTNTHTFQANVSFTGNGIGLTTNTGAIYLGGISDANWKIGRNTGVITKWVYTNNTIDVVTANSNLEGFTIGLVNGGSYFETGYLGTYIAGNVTVGNTSSNLTINSTAYTVGTTVVNSSVVNAASHTVGSSFIANSSGVYHTGTVNAATVQVGTSVVANSSRFVIGTAVGLQANGGIGTSGQVLTSNATTVYWSTPTTGTVTSVASGNGLTGGPITSTGTLSVLANNGIIANSTGTFVFGNTGLVVNSTGVHVNSSYIGTLTANNATNLGGVAAASYVQNTDSRTLSGNIVFSGANVTFSGTLASTGRAYMEIASLVDGATITPNFGSDNNFTVTLAGNRTLANPTSPTAGQTGIIFVVQDGTGGRTLAYGSYWKFTNNTAPVLTTTANAVDAIVYTVRTSTSIAAQILYNVG